MKYAHLAQRVRECRSLLSQNRGFRIVTVVAAACAALLAVTAWVPASAASSQAAIDLGIRQFAFAPQEITVAPGTKIYAAEPANADDAARSLKAGHIIEYDAPQTVADGLKVPLRERTWHFVSTYVTDILIASEEEIIEAMRLTWQRMKIVIEPSSAVPLAAILRNRDVFAGKKVGVIVTGGNVDLSKLPWMLK